MHNTPVNRINVTQSEFTFLDRRKVRNSEKKIRFRNQVLFPVWPSAVDNLRECISPCVPNRLNFKTDLKLLSCLTELQITLRSDTLSYETVKYLHQKAALLNTHIYTQKIPTFSRIDCRWQIGPIQGPVRAWMRRKLCFNTIFLHEWRLKKLLKGTSFT